MNDIPSHEQDALSRQLEYERRLAELHKEYAEDLGLYAVQNATFIADTEINFSSEAEFQEHLQREAQKKELQAVTNGALIVNTFDLIDPAPNSSTFTAVHNSLNRQIPQFNNVTAWLAHHQYTSFIIPPGDNRLGIIEKQRRFRPDIYMPMPVWLVGEQYNEQGWEYLFVATRSHTGQPHVEDPLSANFQLLRGRSTARIAEPETYVPTQAEIEAAHDVEHMTFKFDPAQSAKKAGACPKMTSLNLINGVSDFDMQKFGVTERLMKFPVAYGVSTETIESHLASYRQLRKQISAWNGSLKPDVLRVAFGGSQDGKLPYNLLPLFFKMGIANPPEIYQYPGNDFHPNAVATALYCNYVCNPDAKSFV